MSEHQSSPGIARPDIVERLRKGESHGVIIPCADLRDAADEIERLRAQSWKYLQEVGAQARRTDAVAQKSSTHACLTCCGDGHIQTHADGRSIECPDCSATGRGPAHDPAIDGVNLATGERENEETDSAYFRPVQGGDKGEAGWRFAPVTPTQAMLAAAENAREAYTPYCYGDIYTEMVAAAPQPPAIASNEPIPDRYRNEMLRGLIAFFSESVHAVWDCGEIADCLSGMMSDASSVSSTDREYDPNVAPCDDAEFGMKP